MRLRFYELSANADLDLEDIFDYTHREFGFDQAIKYLEDLEGVLQQLVINPELGRQRNEVRPDLRSFPISSHIIFYRILPDRLRIVGVLHASRDVTRHLRDE